MNGVALFLLEPDKEKKKEYIILKIREMFQNYGLEVFQMDLALPDAFDRLAKIDEYFLSIPFDKKHIVFSVDGDGFGLSLKMDGLWVDNIAYNVFTYLTKHPQFFQERLSGINSWYISILNSVRSGVSYIEKMYPHLDGTEEMIFPCFMGRNSENSMDDREYDILFIADFSEESETFLKELEKQNISTVVYGNRWDSAYRKQKECIRILEEQKRVYDNKLDFMGQSKVTVFFHGSEDRNVDIDVISAMANGSFTVTEEREEFREIFTKDELLLYQPEQWQEMVQQIFGLLKNIDQLKKNQKSGKDKARKFGDLSSFVEKILNRCK